MFDAGLVLEGGGLKGVYTAGVLDFFLDKELEFSRCYGVSAGACALCSYLSKQRGRSIRTYQDYINDKRYCSIQSLLTTGDLFNAKFCYEEIPDKLLPFDYETYAAYSGKAYAVVTNVDTGKAEYLSMQPMPEGLLAVRASASLPLVSRKVKIGGKPYLDGGVSDSIPFEKAFADGCKKVVVVMTKEVGFRRKPNSHMLLFHACYPGKREFINQMKIRHITYNSCQKRLKKAVQEGRAFVIRPKKPNSVSRLEKDVSKLRALYDEGYADAAAAYSDLLAFLS